MGEESIIISGLMGRSHESNVYVYSGSSTNVMYKHFFKQLPGHMQAKASPHESQLVNFVGHNVWLEGIIMLALTIIDYPQGRSSTQLIRFFIINAPSPYNVICGRTTMHKFKEIASTIHGAIKFRTNSGVRTIYTEGRSV